MSDFRKYDHVERWGHPDVEGIEIGTVHVFPKLDGTNGSIWRGHGVVDPRLIVMAGSRTRQLGRVHHEEEPRDNHGFERWVCGEQYEMWRAVLDEHPAWQIYGEWLVPHTLKTYREEAWRRFWVFDVWHRGEGRYLPFDDYASELATLGADCIEPLCTIVNPSEEQLRREVEANTFMIRDGAGAGEGIVIKNYEWQNKYGRQPWAKIVRNEFKEENRRAFGTTEKHGEFQVEAAIAERYVTRALVDKERAKVRLAIMEENGAAGVTFESVEATYRKQMIPRLLQTVYHAIVTEEMWTAVKEHRDPTINFKRLRAQVIHWTKKHASDLF